MDFIIFAEPDLEWNWWHSFEHLYNFGSVLVLTELIRVSQIRWACLLCLFKCWALSMTNERSRLYSISCHQSYMNGFTFIDPIPFLDSSLLYQTYIKNIHWAQLIIIYMCSYNHFLQFLRSRLCCIFVSPQVCYFTLYIRYFLLSSARSSLKNGFKKWLFKI